MRCPFAAWDPITGPAGAFTGGPKKVVHHKTQGSTLAGARAAYRANRSDPHFTVHPDGVHQHVDTAYASRALRNASGGVQTGRDGAIQIEVVGFSGSTAPAATLGHLLALLVWLRDAEGVAPVWPMGRPPTTAEAGYGLNTPHRNAAVWDRTGGHYGHSQVPENTHWDPAYTDAEWTQVYSVTNPPPPPPRQELPEVFIGYYPNGMAFVMYANGTKRIIDGSEIDALKSVMPAVQCGPLLDKTPTV
jgi:hypothetical protein